MSYSGFNATTPTTPGHVFEVTFDPGAALDLDGLSTTWDLPITDWSRDDATGDLYAATDSALRASPGTTSWVLAAPGMPNVEVTGLTTTDGQYLYAASHGLSACRLDLQ